MQESVVAKSEMFLCGANRLPDPFRLMPSLFELSSRFEALDSGHTKWIKELMTVPKLLTKMSFNWTKQAPKGSWALSFSQCLSSQQGAGCKDPRDIVYSILGLVQDPKFDRTKVVPDYEKPVAIVYAEAFAELIRCEGSLHALSSVDYYKNAASDYGLPSWLPDWKNTSEKPILSYSIDNTSEHHFQAAISTGPPVLRLSQDFRKLQIAGIRIAKIATIVDKDYAALTPQSNGTRAQITEQTSQKPSGRSQANRRRAAAPQDEETGKRIFHLNKGDLPETVNRGNLIAHKLLLKILENGGEDAIRYWPIDEDQEFIDHATDDQLCAVYLPRVGRLPHMEDGILAIVNEVAMPGDVVVVPFGGQVPFVLRPGGDKLCLLWSVLFRDICMGWLLLR